jgi:uracil-DNA glycosylase
MKNIALEASWIEVVQDELAKPYMLDLAAFIKEERKRATVFPPKELVFAAMNKTPYDKVRVVIVGQDPYHGPGQAHGLCFSVPQGISHPPSLQNILKELQEDLGIPIPKHGCLEKWAEQGILLLNATLTVRQGEPLSHARRGWEQFTDAVIQKVAEKKDPVIFVLWGKNAEAKCKNIRHPHIVLKAAHPSPLSAHNGFFGCRHFSKINSFLATPINWGLE